ncbi:MAG: hypothetical protein E7046_00120 [Lentisphaerae bacterium]|nr:hypothetical protein [Lentisphaerota bacterium]
MFRLRICTLATLFFSSVAALEILADGGVVQGTFVQRKHLHDVNVTLVSTGVWSFEKDRAFVWKTLKPVSSTFVATPTNYSFTVGGRTVSRRLEMTIDNLAQVFEMKEMKGAVEKVESDKSNNPVFKSDGIEIPSSVKVLFKNGDRLEMTLKR